MKNLGNMNFIEPTEVQEKIIPLALEGKDVVVQSKTGSGKTGAFLIPIIQNTVKSDGLSSLIILPTRELALQVYGVAMKMVQGSNIQPVIVYGGASIEAQIRNLRKSPNILIGTPGRLIDLMRRGELSLSKLKYVVLDEADIMLDMGFIDSIKYILSKAPKERQSMLFSATVPEEVLKLSQRFMKNPEVHRVGEQKEMTVSTVSHSYAVSAHGSKVPAMLAYLKEYNPKKSIIFSSTKRGADYIYDVLKTQGYKAAVMHGDLTQAQREKSLMEFRNGTQFLVATNVAARGLDILSVSDIINFDIPDDPKTYVHRVGRSARMGNSGVALTIIRQNDTEEIRRIEKFARIRMTRIELNQEPFKEIGLTGTHSGGRSGRPRHTQGGARPRTGRRGDGRSFQRRN
ncbi:MAG: DEAD/DEAH box helicase [Thermoplasmataceae archaeon]